MPADDPQNIHQKFHQLTNKSNKISSRTNKSNNQQVTNKSKKSTYKCKSKVGRAEEAGPVA